MTDTVKPFSAEEARRWAVALRKGDPANRIAATIDFYAEVVEYLLHTCQQTCTGREQYRGKLRHASNCPAYDLGLVEENQPKDGGM